MGDRVIFGMSVDEALLNRQFIWPDSDDLAFTYNGQILARPSGAKWEEVMLGSAPLNFQPRIYSGQTNLMEEVYNAGLVIQDLGSGYQMLSTETCRVGGRITMSAVKVVVNPGVEDRHAFRIGYWDLMAGLFRYTYVDPDDPTYYDGLGYIFGLPSASKVSVINVFSTDTDNYFVIRGQNAYRQEVDGIYRLTYSEGAYFATRVLAVGIATQHGWYARSCGKKVNGVTFCCAAYDSLDKVDGSTGSTLYDYAYSLDGINFSLTTRRLAYAANSGVPTYGYITAIRDIIYAHGKYIVLAASNYDDQAYCHKTLLALPGLANSTDPYPADRMMELTESSTPHSRVSRLMHYPNAGSGGIVMFAAAHYYQTPGIIIHAVDLDYRLNTVIMEGMGHSPVWPSPSDPEYRENSGDYLRTVNGATPVPLGPAAPGYNGSFWTDNIATTLHDPLTDKFIIPCLYDNVGGHGSLVVKRSFVESDYGVGAWSCDGSANALPVEIRYSATWGAGESFPGLGVYQQICGQIKIVRS